VSGAHQDGVDRIASGSGEAVSLQKAVAFGVTDDRFDGAASSQFPFDCWRSIARTLRHMDFWRCETVPAIAFIDIGARDRHAGEPFDLPDLAAVGARVGDGYRDLDAEFIARARLALGNAFDLRRVQRVDLVLVGGLLRQELLHPSEPRRAGVFEIGPSFDLAFDVAYQRARPGSASWGQDKNSAK
jgi:hypothetical protein